MNLNLLHLDDALLAQPRFLAAAAAKGARQVDLRAPGAGIRLWAGDKKLQALKESLRPCFHGPDLKSPFVTWMGSGDFHHVTALILELMHEANGEPITVIQFDNHPDWVSHADGLHCGSWVRAGIEKNLVQRVVSIGVNSRDVVWPELKGAGLAHVASGRHRLYALRPVALSIAGRRFGKKRDALRKSLNAMGQIRPEFDQDVARRLLRDITTDSIYVTIDKDVLCVAAAMTNWDQGQMSLDDLLLWLRFLFGKKHVVGVDVVGDYSKPRYSGSALTRLRKLAEVALDQPRPVRHMPAGTAGSGSASAPPGASPAPSINEAGNIRLLSALEAISC